MTNRTVSFRFPQDLIKTLEIHANRSGKTKTDLVIEAIAEVYGASAPISANTTIASVQQQINTLREEVESLAPRGITQAQTHLQNYTSNFVVAIQQALQSLKDVNSLIGTKLDTPPGPSQDQDAAILEIMADSTPTSSKLLPPLTDVLPHLPQTTFLNAEAAHNPQQLALQIEYQLQAFDQLFAAIPELVFICDRSGHLTYVSPFASRVWGVEQRELLGRRYHHVAIPQEFLDVNLTQVGTVLAFGKLSSTEVAVTSGHTTRYYDYTLSPIHGDTGAVIGVVGTAVDFTQRKQAELELQEALNQCNAMFELANDLIFIVDVETHRILDANLKTARRLRYTRKELFQMVLEDIQTPKATEHFQSVVVPQLERTGSALFNHSLRRKNGGVISVEVSARLMDFGDRLAYQSFARDLSSRPETELE
ncbi:MAG: PAS domain-containing protein [Cyanobacteria bacterium J06638_20]